MAEAGERVVVGIGEVLWDMLPGGKQLGGAPANFAFAAGQLGARGVVVSAVGEDAAGREIVEQLRGKGLATEWVAVDPYHPTGWVSVRLDARGVPDYVIHRAVAWDHLRWSPKLEELAGRADAVCFGSLAQREGETRESVRRFVMRTREDCLRVCDVNLRQAYYDREVLEWSVRHCSVLKLNDGELPVVADLLEIGGDGVPAARAIVKRFGVGVVAVTRGERGSWLVTETELSEEKAEAGIEVVDTVGAGDAFTAALVVGTLKGRPLGEVHRVAGRVAGYVCSRRGGMVELGAVTNPGSGSV